MAWQDLAATTFDEYIAGGSERDDLIEARDEVVPLQDVSDLQVVFREEPPPLPVFLRDRFYLHFPRLSLEQFKAVALCETILFPETFQSLSKLKGWEYINEDWWTWGRTELGFMWGKGSGKDTMARVISCRISHLLTCMSAPHLYYNYDEAASIDILNVARSSTQANGAFFRPFSRMIQSRPCFADRIDNITINEVQLANHVVAHSGHADQESQEGGNIIFGCADEIASFKVQAETNKAAQSGRSAAMSADAIWDMLVSSGQSRFPKLAKTLAISYPRFKGDFMTQMEDRHKREEDWARRNKTVSTIYFTKKSTYEVNPTITRASLEDQYRKNPEKAAQLYDCIPPEAVNTYFKRPERITHTFRKHSGLIPATDDQGFLFPSAQFTHGKPCAAHLDLAHAEEGDRAGICIAHRMDWMVTKTQDGHLIKRPIVWVDVITSFHALELGEVELQYTMFENFLIGCMGRGLRLVKATADQFQSKQTLQNLARRGVEVGPRSVDRDTSAYDLLKETIYEDRLEIYRRPSRIPGDDEDPCEYELKRLQLVNGIKVDHPPTGSKDESDALAGAVAGVHELSYAELENEVQSENVGWAEKGVPTWTGPKMTKPSTYSTLGTPRPR